jgi:hypothetical protein
VGKLRVHSLDTDDLMLVLLQVFEDVFATPVGLPPPHRHNHRIHLLPDTAPVMVRLYRYPQLVKDELERQCTEMLKQRIICPSSPAFSPVLLVKKHDGSWRFCVVYRALNSKTVLDMFPISVVNELLMNFAAHGSSPNLTCALANIKSAWTWPTTRRRCSESIMATSSFSLCRLASPTHRRCFK